MFVIRECYRVAFTRLRFAFFCEWWTGVELLHAIITTVRVVIAICGVFTKTSCIFERLPN